MKVYLRRVRLNSGGYDNIGRYYGIGAPLYECEDENGLMNEFRAYDRDHAKDIARRRVSDDNGIDPAEVKFYR